MQSHSEGNLSFEAFIGCKDESWLEHLNADPQQSEHAPNRTSREVFSGHYVEVSPLPLPNPELVSDYLVI